MGTIDNVTGSNIRGSAAESGIIKDPAIAQGWNTGLDVTDISAISGGMAESTAGSGLLAGSLGVTGGTGGLSIEVTGPTAVVGG